MITRVFIKGYKSLRDIDISLKPLTVIVGPNASGKSNLLDALGLLSRIVTSRTINDAFDEHRGLPLEAFFVPPGGVEELLKQHTLQFTLGVDVELSLDVIEHTEKLVRDLCVRACPDKAIRDDRAQTGDVERLHALRNNNRVLHACRTSQGDERTVTSSQTGWNA